ncbi:MAG: hypothetical protein PSX71_10030 [bacterium]|nr:hypothetical protein [bacterium]
MIIRTFLAAGMAVLLAGCVGNGDTVVERATVPADSPDSFLTYPNTQASLAAGDYDVVVATPAPAQSGTYKLVITRDDGSMQTVNGSWSSSGGPSPTAAGNPVYPVTLAHAGGLRIELQAVLPATGYVYLRRKNQVGNQVVAQSTADGSGHSLLDMPVSRISSADYATAYYTAVDPAGARTTLAAWKQKNGFDAGVDSHVTFRDAKDLGYGRDMYARKNGDGSIAVFVNNYVVALQPGSSSNYGPLNVDAAISGDARYFQGSNAIEFSPANQDDPADPNGSMMIAKFFTFDKKGNRITSADLDGRGVKHMPGMCWACHGGQTLPLDENRKFQAQSLRSAKVNFIDVDHLEYSLQNGYHRAQLEPGLRTINDYVAGTFTAMKARDITTTQGKWSADFARELMAGRYNNGLSATFVDDFVPAGWQEGSGRPAGVSQLFREVVGPHCAGCHALQGLAASHEPGVDGTGNLGNAINFSSYEKFISNRSRIIDYVYQRGIMPMSLRNFESFWSAPERGPSLLAAFLADPALFDATGKVIQPGLPVARPGADRTVKSPVQLDGNASSFAGTYAWAIVSGPLDATLTNAGTARPVLTAPTSGSVQLSLTVTNSKGSNTAHVVYAVNNSLPKLQTELTFVDDVRPLFSSYGCTACHKSTGIAGIPVYWSDETDANGVKLYQRVMARVDLRDPENSRLLTKPGSLNHGGGLLIDTSTPSGLADYSTIVNWIRTGAVCGSNPLPVDAGCP